MRHFRIHGVRAAVEWLSRHYTRYHSLVAWPAFLLVLVLGGAGGAAVILRATLAAIPLAGLVQPDFTPRLSSLTPVSWLGNFAEDGISEGSSGGEGAGTVVLLIPPVAPDLLLADNAELDAASVSQWLFLRLRGESVPLSRRAGMRQVECLALAAWTEARGEEVRGRRAVIWTIINRTIALRHQGQAVLPCDVVLSPAQYQGLDDAKRNWLRRPGESFRLIDANLPVRTEIASADITSLADLRQDARRIFAGEDTHDVTDGATHFAAEESATRLQRIPGHWLHDFRRTAIIGRHAFYAQR